MPRVFKNMNRFVYVFACLLLLSACSPSENKKNSKDTALHQADTGQALVEPRLQDVGAEVLETLESNDYTAFSTYISPSKGLVFSPYAHIELSSSKRLLPEDFLEAIDKNWILTWGKYDGTGEPIKLSVKEYLTKFVYNADYLNAERTGVNEIIGKGNTLNNLKEVFPNSEFIEYHFNGFDTKYKGMDWKSLRLVFEREGGNLRLIAVVHDQWTI